MSELTNRKNLEDGDYGEFTIIEGDKPYKLRYELHKGRLTIKDPDGRNKVSIDKRDGRVAIERRGEVDWHREENK